MDKASAVRCLCQTLLDNVVWPVEISAITDDENLRDFLRSQACGETISRPGVMDAVCELGIVHLEDWQRELHAEWAKVRNTKRRYNLSLEIGQLEKLWIELGEWIDE